ncbi:MCE family protein [Mycolicibacterium diernhoferi]|uniref:MCE family protein n=1 Tax=Mycolicibacterium diernhoferi TaxID=1801 RepID=A0A1Q4HC25_9MYCO|nr:MlaD family protein [Mycolicibacterium diernhoferi]OJZ65097.1 mammalian cell entry protein [Mycolicibacterium diernhoferi]OPE52393.1 mammalian cell entry protein [Mycolicibacterium diernhoferi]PEG55025.1 MCE family protein [Mycolicibacterium diernhoferi]QYL23692.1 MCE family protein [Mycolicibacterium diernhoferi]
MLTKRIKLQLALFGVVALVAGGIMAFSYVQVPAMFGVGQYTVTVQLPQAAGLYQSGNVSYRGTNVGRVSTVRLTDNGGVEAVLSLNSDVPIPSDLTAEVHSASAIGEQFVALVPRSADGPMLKNGDVIPEDRTTVPPPINKLLDATNRGIQAIPRDNVKTVIDESYTAVGRLGPELSRIVRGSTQLAIDARANLDPLLALIDKAGPVLDSQAETARSINAWASNLKNLTGQLRDADQSVAGLLEKGAAATDEGRALFDRLKPTLPTLMANLVSIGEVAVVYQPAIEQVLVLEPQVVASLQGALLANKDSRRETPGLYVSFNLNLNLPPPCTTGFLPTDQLLGPAAETTADLPPGDLYCRIPQDSWNVVRGNRNYPCLNRPGKRAPTARMCESDEEYVPLNDGFNWKGDQNATLSGQAIPQLRPEPAAGAPTPVPPVAVAEYDPNTGEYMGPDGQIYTQADLGNQTEGRTWQSMLVPAAG